jgi:UDP-GlcNAc:undecaprenyl-phosphate GlcNAc-1-phosphate transferase
VTVPDAILAALAALIAALISFALCPLAGRWARRIGVVSIPSTDRWRRQPTPLLGGLAIAAGTVVAALVFRGGDRTVTALLAPAIGVLILGLIDDKITLGPTAKLVGSLAAGAALVYLLSRSATRLPPSPLVVLAVIWFAAVVHAVNLLDNIDGLAAGVGAITASGTAIVLLEYGAPGAAALLLALAGALLGFLPWNLHPARLFMGDGGSLFVGAILGGSSLVPWFTSEKSSSFWSMAMAVALIVPIGEASFVTALRWMAGRKPTRGGIDHTSHRLVSMGFSERRSVLFLYVVALAAAAVAAWMGRSGTAALPATAVLLVAVGLGAVYLAHVPTYQGEDFAALQRVPFGALLRSALDRSHAAQVLLDLVLITACYYAAYRLRFEGESLDIFLPSFAASLPIVLVCKLVAHYASGLYRRSWFTFGVSDIAAVSRAILVGTTAAVLAATYLYRFERFSRGVFIIDAMLLLLAILASRLSFRLMAHAAVVQSSRAKRVLICGARERGQLLAREMLANTGWCLRPVGFIDGVASSEHSILGVRVCGTVENLSDLIRQLRVEEVVFSGDPLDPIKQQAAVRVCAELGVPVRELVFDIRQPLVDRSGTTAA